MTFDRGISRNSKAVRLSEQMLRDVRNGRFTAGQLLPAELELSAQYQVSRSTVRRVLAWLVAEGHLIKMPQRGVVVPGAAVEANGAAAKQVAWITSALSADAEAYARGLHEALADSGFTLGMYCSQADPVRFRQLLAHLLAMRPAGIVLQLNEQPPQIADLEPLSQSLTASGIPLVCLDCADRLRILPCDHIHGAPHAAARLVARHLVSHHYRDVTLLLDHPREDGLPAITGLRSGLAPAGITLPDDRIVSYTAPHGYGQVPNPFIDAEQKMRELLAGGFRRGTLLATHDYPAIGILRAVLAAGLRVPEEVQVISLGSCQIGGAAPRRLTTVEVHHEESGYHAGCQLLCRIAGDTSPVKELFLATGELLPGETG